MSRGALARDVLPWADPYIAQLIKKLQDEVRLERRRMGRRADCLIGATRHSMPQVDPDPESSQLLVDDLEMPWYDTQADDEPIEDDRWSDRRGDAACS